MAGFKSLGMLLATMAAEGAGISRHKAARAQRFLFKHRGAKRHRKLVRRVIAAQQQHQRDVTQRRIAQALKWHQESRPVGK